MPLDSIIVKGAREHNLKNIDVTIPRDKLVLYRRFRLGKSSLAFDTIYARPAPLHGVALAYAAVPGPMEKRTLTTSGLSPPYPSTRKGEPQPRSTVGTITEVYDYCVSSSPGWHRTAPSAGVRSHGRQWSRSLTPSQSS